MSLGQVNPLGHARRLEKLVRKWGTCSSKLRHQCTERLFDSQHKLRTSGKGFWTFFFCLSPVHSFFCSTVEPRWGNAGDIHCCHKGLHIVLSLVSTCWRGSAHYVLYSVCALWTFKPSCDTSLELWGRVCWRYHGSLKSWTGPWSLGQLDVTDFLPGRGEETLKWRQKQCCSHLNHRIHRLVDYRPIQLPAPLLVLLQQQCTPSIPCSREVSPLCCFIWSSMDALWMPVLVGTWGMPCAFQPNWSSKMPRVWCVCTSVASVCVSGGMKATLLPLEPWWQSIFTTPLLVQWCPGPPKHCFHFSDTVCN